MDTDKNTNDDKEQSLEQYVESCFITEDDPGMLLSWEPALDTFVKNANELISPNQPPWISTLPGQMSGSSFQQDMINHLASVGGGKYGNVLIAPNNIAQYANVGERLRDIEME
jgi:hypothetical protein